MTHNKLRTARLDQWPDPLTADDSLAEAARNHAKDYIANNCKLAESTKLDPVSYDFEYADRSTPPPLPLFLLERGALCLLTCFKTYAIRS